MARIRDALAELHAYVLALDAERHRIRSRMTRLSRTGERSEKLARLRRRRLEIGEQLELLDATITALRELADPLGRCL